MVERASRKVGKILQGTIAVVKGSEPLWPQQWNRQVCRCHFLQRCNLTLAQGKFISWWASKLGYFIVVYLNAFYFSGCCLHSSWSLSCRKSWISSKTFGIATGLGSKRIQYFPMAFQTIYTIFQRNMAWRKVVIIRKEILENFSILIAVNKIAIFLIQPN